MSPSSRLDVTLAQPEAFEPRKEHVSYSLADEKVDACKLMFVPLMFTSEWRSSSGRIFRPKHGYFTVTFELLEDGTVSAFHPTLPVMGHGTTHEEALRDFADTFAFQWQNLVKVAEADLTKGGCARREAMMDAAVEAE